MPDRSPPLPTGSTAGRWIVLAGLVLLFWALRAAHAVFLPIAAGAFLIALVHPIYGWVADRTHRVLGFLAAFVTVLLGFAAFFVLVGWALTSVVSVLPEYEEQFRRAYDGFQAWTRSFGLTLPEPQGLIDEATDGGGGSASGEGFSSGLVTSVAQTVGLQVQAFLTYFFLILAFVALGIPEVKPYAGKLGVIGGVGDKVRAAAQEVGHKFRAYLGALTISAAITAVLTAAFGLAIGLEFALVFALLSFLMNYVPTIGSAIAVIPPTLFSLVQFDGLTMPLVVFLGFAAIELTVGNYVAPKVEGRILSIAPTVVLAAIVFWGWLWGVVGALLAVPLTIAVALFCKHFEGARWVSQIIRERPEDAKADA